MIKIDLQYSIINAETDEDNEESLAQNHLKNIGYTALKIFFVLAFISSVYIYETINLNAFKAKLQEQITAHDNIEQRVRIKTALLKKLKKSKSKFINLYEKIVTAAELTKPRLIFLKAMELLNTLRKETLWFKTVDYNKGMLSIKGYSLSKKVLDTFLLDINQRKNIFKSILLVKSQKKKIKNRSIRSFFLEIKLLN